MNPRDVIVAAMAEVAKALAHPARVDLMQHVAQGERPVERLAELTGQSMANTSQHLKLLRRAGLVASRRDGKKILYRIASKSVLGLINGIQDVVEEISSEARMVISDYFSALDRLEPVSREDLLSRLHEGDITILDVRPQDEFELGHVPGARQVQVEEVDQIAAQIPKDQPVVAYCRGKYCVASFKTVSRLRELGYDVRRMEDGFPEWLAAGLSVARGI